MVANDNLMCERNPHEIIYALVESLNEMKLLLTHLYRAIIKQNVYQLIIVSIAKDCYAHIFIVKKYCFIFNKNLTKNVFSEM